MSINDETCDFCGTHIDPIGCDTTLTLGGKYWDGQCLEGMHALWDKYSDDQMRQMIDFFQGRYDADPIDPNNRVEATPGAWSYRAGQLHNRDMATHMRRCLNSRTS